MAVIGSLVVDLLLKTAAFNADLARSSKSVATSAASMNRSLSSIGIGFGGLISARVIRQLTRVNTEALKLAATMSGPLGDASRKYLAESQKFSQSFNLGVAQGFLQSFMGSLVNTTSELEAATAAGRLLGSLLGEVFSGVLTIFDAVASRADAIKAKVDALSGAFKYLVSLAEMVTFQQPGSLQPGGTTGLSFGAMQDELNKGTAGYLAYGEAIKTTKVQQDGLNAATDFMHDLLSRQEELWSDIRTPMEEYEKALQKIQAAHATGELAARAQAKAQLDLATSYVSAGAQITSTLAGAFAKSKGFAIANAVMNVAQGITQALTLPFPLNWAQVAAVTAAGVAQIATIRSTQSGSGKTPSAKSGAAAKSTGAQTNGEGRARSAKQAVNINLMGQGGFTRDQVRALAGELNELVADGATIRTN